MSKRHGILVAVCAMLITGCCANKPTPESASVDIDAEITKAKKPMVLLIGEFGPGGADASVRFLLDNPAIKSKANGIELLTIDLSVSRNRAMAARYHTAKTPVLVCLSSLGVIGSRDDAPVTRALVDERIGQLLQTASKLDEELTTLPMVALKTKPSADEPESSFAEFLLAHQNDREAIPYLEKLINSKTATTTARISAWVALARAHLWIAEPEKGRHEAKKLIADLGAAHPNAVAGGNLVLGMQDATAKRFLLARHEFESAIYAAPASDYGKQAATELAKLPKDTQ